MLRSQVIRASTALVLLLLVASNGFLLWEWLSFQRQVTGAREAAGAALQRAVRDVEDFRTSTIAFRAPIDEQLPVRARIPLRRTLRLPVSTAIPIEEEFDTTIMVEGPFGLTFPVDITIPIDLTIPVDLVIPVEVDETLEIATTVPVDLEVPVTVEVSATELGTFLGRLQSNLRALEEALR
jgi:hypothetical protein